jgi:ATP-dependent Lon protease
MRISFIKVSHVIALAPGTSTGLSYSKIGGSVMIIESSLASMRTGKASIKFTGNLREGSKESMQIAYSFARSYLKSIGNDFLEK